MAGRRARRPRRIPPRLLTIAGSDSGGGAGIQADLKTFAAHGAYGMSAITALTAQNTLGVRAVHEVPPEIVAAQIDAVFEDIGVDAVKIGMLASAPIVRAVADRLRFWRPVHVVLDPVMVAKSGDALLRDDAVEAVLGELVPLCSLVTPNLPELERMTGLPVATEEERRAAASKLGPAVLAKGGHGEGAEVVDLLVLDGTVHRFHHRRLATSSTHGTGCTVSSAIAARLGRGEELREAVGGAIRYLHRAMEAAYPLGGGHGPVDHLYELFPEKEE
ncbi:MAG TPA: bifunctional hydroxymethylpyrimidine kinase/phosphomethylpyrimidine kinase [Thermoanaerobaculia bacterium]|nr:bifunctional hydroxymethylpyrimidine kinase/phosphomethylpyrimidine kinase [Thermoanaerobaculia bacterium]